MVISLVDYRRLRLAVAETLARWPGATRCCSAQRVLKTRTPNGDLPANVDPTFNRVRQAQRIPIKVHIERVPSDLRLIAGRTATVGRTDDPHGLLTRLLLASRVVYTIFIAAVGFDARLLRRPHACTAWPLARRRVFDA
jgi:hypothetical protein